MVAASVERTSASRPSTDGRHPDREALDVATAAIRRNLLAVLGENVYESWLKGLEVVEVSGGTVVFSVATKFLRNWVGTHFSGKVLAATVTVVRDAERVDFTVRSTARSRDSQATTPHATTPPATALPAASSPVRDTVPPTFKAVARRGPDGPGSPLDPRLIFDDFVVGDANRLAFAAARGVAGGDGDTATTFVHGVTGRGKTHLLQAACTLAVAGGRKVAYMTAERFMYGFVVDVKGRGAAEFRAALGCADLVVVDDVQFLQGAGATNELRRLVRTVQEGERSVLLAADRPVRELVCLDEATRDRLSKGTVVHVGEPEFELRIALVQSRLAAASARFPALSYDRDVVVLLATTVADDGREVEGAVNRLVALSSLDPRPIGVEAARVAIRDMVSCREPRKVRIEDIQRLVANHYNVQRSDILSARRTADIVRPRQVAMYISKVETSRSLPEIGRRFGGRDHTTVLYAVRKIEGLCASDKALSDEIDLLRRMLTN